MRPSDYYNEIIYGWKSLAISLFSLLIKPMVYMRGNV